MSERLEWLPCPFCGSEPSLGHALDREAFETFQKTHDGASVISVWCKNHKKCQATMTISIDYPLDYEEAVLILNRRWNRRTEE